MNSQSQSTTTWMKRVAKQFARDCTSVRIPFRQRFLYWSAYLKLAKRGVMVYSETEDACYEDSPWKRRYDARCDRINALLAKQVGRASAVEVPAFAHDELSLEDLRWLMRQNIPFVLRGGAHGLPIKNWTLDYFEQTVGSCEVPINEASDRPSTDVARPTKAHNYYNFRRGTVAEVVQSIRNGGKMRITTAEDVMHHDNGRLRQDLGIDHWERISGWSDNQHRWLKSRMYAGKVVGAQLLMQPEGAFTLWHAEPGDNFFVLAKGVKHWTMAHPYYTAAMRPRVKQTTNYTGSNIDVREPDDVQQQRGFEGYLGVPKVKVVMRPGDVLRVPNHWWHTVVTEPGDYTLAATIRAACMPNLVGPGLLALRMRDREYFQMAKAIAEEGRIRDSHIGFPRKSRSESSNTG